MRGARSGFLGLVTVGALLGGACGSDGTTTSTGAPPTDPAGGTDPVAGTDPAGTDPAAPRPTNAPPGGPTEAQAFWQEALATCNEFIAANGIGDPFDGSASDPTVGVTFDDEIAPGVFRIEDARGVELLVDVDNRQVTGLDGPAGILPRDYLFVCPETFFVGTFDEDGLEDEAAPTPAEAVFYEALGRCNAYSFEQAEFEPFDGSATDPMAGVVPGAEVSPGVYEVIDNDGVRLLIDTNERVVTGPDGPDGVLPRPYSFWCPADVFPGTLDELGDEEDAAALALRADGLGAVDFGADPDTTIDAVSQSLGPPDEDSGWIGAFSAWGTCPGTEIRVARWANLDVLFTDSTDTGVTAAPGPHFFNWRVPDLSGAGAPSGLTTPAGIGLGSTVGELRAAYGADATVDFDPDFDSWYFLVEGGPDGGISGAVEGSDPTDEITFITGGALCGD